MSTFSCLSSNLGDPLITFNGHGIIKSNIPADKFSLASAIRIIRMRSAILFSEDALPSFCWFFAPAATRNIICSILASGQLVIASSVNSETLTISPRSGYTFAIIYGDTVTVALAAQKLLNDVGSLVDSYPQTTCLPGYLYLRTSAPTESPTTELAVFEVPMPSTISGEGGPK